VVSVPISAGRLPAGKVVAIAGLVLAVIAAGFIGWHFFWPRGGAGSPEEAAEQMMLAAANQDPVALLDLVSPAEIEGLDGIYEVVRDRAEEEGLVEGDGITDAVEVEFSGLEFDVEELGDDMARVTLVDGTYDARWDPAKLPDRLDFVEDETEAASESGDLEDLWEDDDVEPSLVTVKEGGRWYVTVIGTAADYAYQAAEQASEYDGFDLEEPDFDLLDEDLEPIVGDDPEEVVENLVDAVNEGDAEDLLANFPEELGRPLRPYLPVIEGLQRESDWGDQVGVNVSVDELKMSTEKLDDGKVKVTVDEGYFYGSVWEDYDDYDGGSAQIDGECVTAADDYDSETVCIRDDPYAAESGVEELFFVVSEVEDGFQLDPTATWIEYAATVVENLDSAIIDDIIDDIEEEVS